MNLSKLYYNTSFPGSFSGAGNFYREVKKLHPQATKKQISEFLIAQDTYTLHKSIKRPKKYRSTIVFGPRELWQIDLLDFQKIASVNREYRYLCVIIDCFTKFVWVKPLKNKRGVSIVKALALLLMTERPKLIQADQGTEFFNKNVQKMLEAFGPRLYHTYSEKKAAIVERVQRTLRSRLGRIFTKHNNKVWIDHIDKVVNSYNNSLHRSIGMRPIEVKEEHTAVIFSRLFPHVDRDKPKFNVGDHVRIISKKTFLQKEYEKGWTDEFFVIKRVLKTNPVTYQIEDLQGEDVTGGFYAEELQNVKVLR